jgi:hypothetical protein
VVTFDVFRLPSGDEVLVREIPDPSPRTAPTAGPTIESVLARADEVNCGAGMRAVLAVGQRYAAYTTVCAYTYALMLAPRANRTRMLVNARPSRGKPGFLRVWVSAEAFEEFLPIGADRVREVLHHDESELVLDSDEQLAFAHSLANVLDEIQSAEANTSEQSGADSGV